MSVVKNIELGPTLLSRFDLIYIILDQPDRANDAKLARHLVNFYFCDDERDRTRHENIIPKEILASYISYARKHIIPKISESAGEALVEAYKEMRSKSGADRGKKIISATPRQLESLIRISEALARMSYSEVVTENHVKEALALMSKAIQEAATDPETGEIDMSILTTGFSSHDEGILTSQLELVKEIVSKASRSRIKLADLVTEFNSQKSAGVEDLSSQEIMKLVRTLEKEKELEFKNGQIRYLGYGDD
jgi:DNA replication licensing factor MCM4